MTRTGFVLVCFIVLLSSSCGDNATGITPPVLPHNPVNEAWKAVENLAYAYETQDLDLVEATLDPDFMHNLDVVDWADYNGDGIIDTYWGLDIELAWFQNLFDTADEIDMNFSGDDEQIWSGDSTGNSLELHRTFNIIVFYESVPNQGIQASGTMIFICRPYTDNEWRIWQLFLQPRWWPLE